MPERNFQNLILIIDNAPGVAKGTGSTVIAGGSAASSVYFGLDQWLTVASLGVAVVGLVFTGASIWIAYSRLIEERQANRLKEFELKIKKL